MTMHRIHVEEWVENPFYFLVFMMPARNDNAMDIKLYKYQNLFRLVHEMPNSFMTTILNFCLMFNYIGAEQSG